MTDLHEELFPNKPLERKMDLHNNQVGMDYFMELLPGIHRQFFETSFFVEEFLNKTKSARLLKNLDGDFDGNLVYLTPLFRNFIKFSAVGNAVEITVGCT